MAVTDTAVLYLPRSTYSGTGNWLDISGNNYHGEITDATYDSGRGAFLFNSSTDVIDVETNADLDLTTSETLTLMAVFEYNGTTGFQFIAGKEEQAGTVYPGYCLEHNPTGPYLTGYITDGTNSQSIADLGVGVLTTGVVYVAAITIDLATSDLMRGYWDGSEQYSGVDISAVGSPSNAQAFSIGQTGAGNDPFNGYVYAVAVWTSILSAGDIATAGTEMKTVSGVTPGVDIDFSTGIATIIGGNI